MMSAVATPRFGCEFDRFLYATVGEYNGMPLNVLSALARMDVDPWEEAAKLMRLPQDGAIKQLASLLGALRNAPVTNFDPGHVAVALVALLPRPLARAHPLLKACAQATRGQSPVIVCTLMSVLTYVIFVLFSIWWSGNLQASKEIQSAAASPATIDAAAAPATREADSPTGRVKRE